MSPVVRITRAIVSRPARPMPTCRSEATLRMERSSSLSSSSVSSSNDSSFCIGSFAKWLTMLKSLSMGAMQYVIEILLNIITPATSSTITKRMR